MGSEQQFCLKWNNHQSTIVAGFDTLLESGTLVDCTLAAEGQYLKAHKVVLSACSPYFEVRKFKILCLKEPIGSFVFGCEIEQCVFFFYSCY